LPRSAVCRSVCQARRQTRPAGRLQNHPATRLAPSEGNPRHSQGPCSKYPRSARKLREQPGRSEAASVGSLVPSKQLTTANGSLDGCIFGDAGHEPSTPTLKLAIGRKPVRWSAA
jgi:hypothetical protein